MRVEPASETGGLHDPLYDETYRPHLFALRSGDSRYPFAIECSLKLDPLTRMFSVVLVTRRGRKETSTVEVSESLIAEKSCVTSEWKQISNPSVCAINERLINECHA